MQPYSYFLREVSSIFGRYFTRKIFNVYFTFLKSVSLDLFVIFLFITAPVSVPLTALVGWYGQPRGDDYDT